MNLPRSRRPTPRPLRRRLRCVAGSAFLVFLGVLAQTTSSGAPLVLQTLHAFGADPKNPQCDLLQASDRNFYGTTVFGGTNGENGTVFKITPAGTLTVLHSFNGLNGALPQAGLVQGTDGLLYGTTSSGGASDLGTIFRISTNGQFALLHSFSGTNGSSPQAALVRGNDGNFYGTTAAGGAGANGTIFRITPAGVFTLLYSFPANARNGRAPLGRLLLAVDGAFYGTASQGGANNENGAVFRVTSAGAFSLLASFSGANGSGPAAGLIQTPDGNLYGTTEIGGTADNGTVFRVTTNGILTSLVSFTGPNGSFPRAALTRGNDGNLYGTTSGDRAFGGTNTFGTVFRITPAGALTTLVVFNGTNGATPVAGLSLATDANFYGTTFEGGAGGAGTVFRLVEPPMITSITPLGGSVVVRWTSFAGGVYRVEYNPVLAPGGWIPLAPDIVATSNVTSITNNLAGATRRFFRVRLLP